MKKQVKIIIVCVGTIIVIFSTLIGLRLYNQLQPMLTLKKNEFVFEYGDIVTRNIKEYININEYKSKKKGPPLLETTMKLDIPEDVLYPAVGEYKGTITYRDEKLEFKIIVKDTKSPKIVSYIKNESIETYRGIVPKYIELFDAKDLSPFELTFDDSKVDYDKVGEYILYVKAKDSHDNENLEELNVIIKEKELDLKLDTISVLVTGTTQLNPEIKGVPEKLSYSSSDSETVSVDEQGVIRAKKPGKAIITAKMGEITDTCKVVVKNNPYYKQGK